MSEYWIKCKRCGKKLIKRRSDTLYEFKFGRRENAERICRCGNTNSPQCHFCSQCGSDIKDIEVTPIKRVDDLPVIVMFIHGNIKMKCLRRGCDNETVLNQFPLIEATQENIDALKKRGIT